MTKQLCKYMVDERATRFLVFVTLLFVQITSYCKTLSHIPALLPLPQKVVWNGEQFNISNHPKWLVQRFSEKIPGVQLNDEEAYSLIINKDSAVLTATSPKGLFRGLQTVKQLTFKENGEVYVAGCSITDWPAFKIRGFMQDVGRNFMPLDLLKEQIDVMAAYKFNLFHFHVTDNPGWRLESKKYPQLRSAYSMNRWQGKYYTQEDFLELVKYCADRYITLVPEFDIPGHCEAFRRAFALDSMSDPRVQPILLDLIDELCGLVSKEQMPFLHLGTDEVWFCSGQSNMGFPLSLSERGKEFSAMASDPQLRLMNFHEIAATADVKWDSVTLARVNRLDYFQGTWEKCSPGEAADFSAIAYYFGKSLREKLQVPVGLIQVTVGGAPAEAFVDPGILAIQPGLEGLKTSWFCNASVMEWCRERAAKNISDGRRLEQMHPFMPGYIFEAGIAPFKGLPVKGVIWYQGESNAENPELYSLLLPELVGSLRQNWNNPRLPFILAQLSSIQRPGWEEFRDLQRILVMKLSSTAMIVTSDLGDSLNVHPKRKKEVGDRFSLQVLNKVYGKTVMCDGPLPEKASTNGESILVVEFKAGQYLTTSDSKPLRELEVAREDQIFLPINGALKNNTIVIESKGYKIKQVRYAWKPFSRGNLVNREGLPASTFKIIVN